MQESKPDEARFSGGGPQRCFELLDDFARQSGSATTSGNDISVRDRLVVGVTRLDIDDTKEPCGLKQ